MVLIDRYGRPVTGLRISVTPRCNLNCIFCHSEGIPRTGEKLVLMTPWEIERITRIAMSLGVDSVKLTGGEPMMRPDILDIVERLGRLGLRDLSMTTNGLRISELAGELRKRGLMRINISLHTVDPEKYTKITGLKDPKVGRMLFEKTVEAIRRSLEVGLNPVKLNVVVMKGINEGEISDLIDFAADLDSSGKVILQLIELVRCGNAPEIFEKYYYSLADAERKIRGKAVKKVVRRLHLRTQYLLPNGVWVEFVRPMYNYVFCMNNTRLRITHDGQFKPCLMRSDNHVEFLSAMRSGASDEELKKLLLKAVELREPYWKPPYLKAEVKERS